MKNKYKILLILFMSTLLVLGFGLTYSIFNSSITLGSNQNIAKFIFNTESLDEFQLSLTNLRPGDTKEYAFSISNVSSGKLSDVTVEYEITLKTYHLMPLLIQLYKVDDEDEELVMICDETYDRNELNELVCTSPLQELSYSSDGIDDYKLKVEFLEDEDYKNSIYSNLVDFFNLEISSWQKVGE